MSSSLCSGGSDSFKRLSRVALLFAVDLAFESTSALMIAMKPSAYPVLLRNVEFRTLSVNEISSIKRCDHSSGRLRSATGLSEFRQKKEIC